MLLLLTAAFLLKRYVTQAVPLPAPTPTSSPFEAPIYARDSPSDGCHGRTVLDILWSCVATTFACTWVSVHPNVPFKGEGKWTLLGRRIFLMFFSILAPEFMIVWAFKQWRGAVMIREAVNKASRKAFPDPQDNRRDSWTTAHGHLLQMGGFRLSTTARENFYWGGTSNLGNRLEKPLAIKEDHTLFPYISGIRRRFDEIQLLRWSENRTPEKGLLRTLIPEHFFFRRETAGGAWNHDYSRDIGLEDSILEGVLTIDALERLLSENLIRFPTITEDEINDKSKGDALSKGIALLQLTWFIVQIITRRVQGLAITEMELTTAALAGLNSVMYIFWWSKPHDMRFPLVIRTKAVEELLAKRTEDTTSSFSDRKEFDFREHLWTSMTAPMKDGLSPLGEFLVSFPTKIKKLLSDLAVAISVPPRRLHSFLFRSYRCFTRAKEANSGDPTRTGEKKSSDAPGAAGPEPQSAKEKMPRMRVSKRLILQISAILSDLKQQVYRALIIGAYIFIFCFAFLFSVPAYVINFVLFVPISQILWNDGDDDEYIPMMFAADELGRVFSVMFYSEDAEVSLFSTASIAGALFGGVHCLAWHFSFPSHAEEIMWKTASLGIVGACALSFVGNYLWNMDYYINDLADADEVLRAIGYACLAILQLILTFLIALVYPVFRLMLLVLAVTSLRSLPSSAFDTVQWIEFVPHI